MLGFACYIFGCQSKEEKPVKEEIPNYREDLPPIVQKSLDFHDSSAVFDKSDIACKIVSTTAKDTTQRVRTLMFNTSEGTFSMQQLRDGKEESFQVPIPTSLTDSTTIARSKMYKKYFRYMLGGANVLADSSAQIEENIKDTLFNNIASKEISIRYEPINETPNWYFIINANTGEMLQSRFIYNEGKENERGEYINYGPYISYKGMQLTSELNWHYLNGDFLAKEKIEYWD